MRTDCVTVNTGFGGSSDCRSNDYNALQLALLQMMNCGVLPLGNKDLTGPERASEMIQNPHSMPKQWVKAAMLIRLNTLIRGHSGVSMDVLEKMRCVLRADNLPLQGYLTDLEQNPPQRRCDPCHSSSRQHIGIRRPLPFVLRSWYASG